MKKILSLVLLFLIGCSSEPINIDEMLIERDGVYYTKDTNQLYTGPVFTLFPNGEIKKEFSLKNGLREGSFKSYSQGGGLLEMGTYKNGKPHGDWIIYTGYNKHTKLIYENGILVEELKYKNGERDFSDW